MSSLPNFEQSLLVFTPMEYEAIFGTRGGMGAQLYHEHKDSFGRLEMTVLLDLSKYMTDVFLTHDCEFTCILLRLFLV